MHSNTVESSSVSPILYSGQSSHYISKEYTVPLRPTYSPGHGRKALPGGNSMSREGSAILKMDMAHIEEVCFPRDFHRLISKCIDDDNALFPHEVPDYTILTGRSFWSVMCYYILLSSKPLFIDWRKVYEQLQRNSCVIARR